MRLKFHWPEGLLRGSGSLSSYPDPVSPANPVIHVKAEFCIVQRLVTSTKWKIIIGDYRVASRLPRPNSNGYATARSRNSELSIAKVFSVKYWKTTNAFS